MWTIQRRICESPCQFVVGDRVVLPYKTLENRYMLEILDLRTGRTTDHPGLGPYSALTVAGGEVYGLRDPFAERLSPAGADVIQPVTGEVSRITFPGTLRARLDQLQGGAQDLWVAGERIYVAAAARDGTRATSCLRADPGTAAGPRS